MGLISKHVVWVVLTLSLAACGNLPRGAAIEAEILKNAEDETADFAVYPVTREFLPMVQNWPATGLTHSGATALSWIGSSQGSRAQVIQAGDTLDVFIWDSGENSLITAPGQRVATLTGMRVSESGAIFVPYIGKIKVSGRTPDSARQLVQRRLEEIVPSAQVQLQMTEGRTNSVDLVGGVTNPGAIAMPDQNFSVLGAISAAGGVRDGLTNPQIKLVRGSKVYGTSVSKLYANPHLDTRLHGGDKVIVEDDPRYFLSLGAAGNEAQFSFNRDEVSALDALALIGGVNDQRADPQGVLILREYPADAIDVIERGPSQTRVVFTLDLTTSDGLFSARNFMIHSGDLVLATESPVNNTRTVLGLVGSTFGIARALN